MSKLEPKKAAIFSPTTGSCPIGEITGNNNIDQSKIPVISCEGACIRGEIARLAANIVSKGESYGRGCHGELVTVPQSAIARWICTAEKVILIDGCFLRCHGRILENIIDEDKLIQFDALSHHKKYNDIFDYDDVPEEERKEVAQSVANWIMESLNNPTTEMAAPCEAATASCSPCCG
jgi:uncharacterized metal-binding protein